MNTNRIIGANPDATRRDDWETPREVFEPLDKIFQFSLDAAASVSNNKTDLFLTEADNGLITNWSMYISAQFHSAGMTPPNLNVWLNPPYKGVEAWVEKAYCESYRGGCTVVCLLPPSVDAQWFRKVVVPYADYYWFAGRIKFDHPEEKKTQPTKGNLLAIFRPPMPTPWVRGG